MNYKISRLLIQKLFHTEYGVDLHGTLQQKLYRYSRFLQLDKYIYTSIFIVYI